MIAKRIAAVAAAALLVLAAVVIRDRVIESDSAVDEPPADATVLVCPPELRAVCQSSAGDSVEVEVEDAGVTLDRLAALDDVHDAPVWVTFAPFPAMVDAIRTADGREPLGLAVDTLAASPVALVTTADVAASLASECGDPIALTCVAGSGRSIGFAGTPDSGIGLLGLTGFALDYGAGGIPFDDALFERWLGALVSSVPGVSLRPNTAVFTFQSRSSLMDLAVGADSELVEDNRGRFEVLYPEPMGRIEVVVATRPGTSAPGRLADDLRTELDRAGWSPSGAVEGTTPDGGAMLAVRDLWRDQT